MRSAEGLDIEEDDLHDLRVRAADVWARCARAVIKEAYIMRPDISPVIGWETGEQLEPAFMDMNLHSVRDGAAGKTFPNVTSSTSLTCRTP